MVPLTSISLKVTFLESKAMASFRLPEFLENGPLQVTSRKLAARGRFLALLGLRRRVVYGMLGRVRVTGALGVGTAAGMPLHQASVIVLDPQPAFELPTGAPTVYDLQAVYPDQQTPVLALQAGQQAPLLLDPYEVLVLKAQPRPAYAAQILEAGPLAYWRLGESNGPTAFDQVGPNDGLFVNVANHVLPGALLQDDDGAVRITGAGSHVLITNGAVFNFTGTNPFTLSAWVQWGDLGGRQRLFSNRDPAGGGYGLGIEGESNLVFTAFGSDEAVVKVGSIPTGRWCQVTTVRRAGTVEFYWNGAPAGTNLLGGVLASASPLQLGGNPSAGSEEEPLNGELDEVAVFSRALDPAEIQALYQGQLAPEFPPLITSQPVGLTRYLGCTALFSAAAAGSLPISYQWRFSGSVMPDRTNASLLLSNLSDADAGDYSVTASNVAGMATSSSAALALRTPETYVTPLLADHPVAYWRLDESHGPLVSDSWGSHNGTALGNVRFGLFGAMPCFFQTCAHFDGTPGTQIDVPYAVELESARLQHRMLGAGDGWDQPFAVAADLARREPDSRVSVRGDG